MLVSSWLTQPTGHSLLYCCACWWGGTHVIGRQSPGPVWVRVMAFASGCWHVWRPVQSAQVIGRAAMLPGLSLGRWLVYVFGKHTSDVVACGCTRAAAHAGLILPSPQLLAQHLLAVRRISCPCCWCTSVFPQGGGAQGFHCRGMLCAEMT